MAVSEVSVSGIGDCRCVVKVMRMPALVAETLDERELSTSRPRSELTAARLQRASIMLRSVRTFYRKLKRRKRSLKKELKALRDAEAAAAAAAAASSSAAAAVLEVEDEDVFVQLDNIFK
jgi:hypothetical protein